MFRFERLVRVSINLVYKNVADLSQILFGLVLYLVMTYKFSILHTNCKYIKFVAKTSIGVRNDIHTGFDMLIKKRIHDSINCLGTILYENLYLNDVIKRVS